VRVRGVAVRSGGMLMGLRCVLGGGDMVACFVVLGGFMVRFGCMLVVFGCFLVCFVCHDFPFSCMTSAIPFADGTPGRRWSVFT
jgi:hypothetical protein